MNESLEVRSIHFLICPSSCCLLIGEFNPCVFNEIIHKTCQFFLCHIFLFLSSFITYFFCLRQIFWKTSWQFLKKLNTLLPFDLVILFLLTYVRLKRGWIGIAPLRLHSCDVLKNADSSVVTAGR